MEHTKGPWKDDGSNVRSEKGNVAITFDPDFPVRLTEVNRANARLTAAAPDLLEVVIGLHSALSRMIDEHDPDSIEAEWLSHSHEVINKAKGE